MAHAACRAGRLPRTCGREPCRAAHRVLVVLLLAIVTLVPQAGAQQVVQRGFVEGRTFVYPQEPASRGGHATADVLLRYEATWRAASWVRVAGGFDARAGTDDQVDDSWRLDWSDRRTQRPRLSARRLSATIYRGPFSLEAGKQFVRWGKADILNPTDRFAPRDYLTVVDNDFLAVTAARAIYEGRADTIDVVWVPRFTPSRTPLLTGRWTVLPPLLVEHLAIVDRGAVLPKRSQAGVRWNHIGRGYEASASFYDGFDHLPLFVTVPPAPLGRIDLVRTYPHMRMFGGDAAVPVRWFIVKGEIGYFTSRSPEAAEYGIYVIQVERQVGEWHLVGGYAGDFVTRDAPRIVGVGIPASSQQLDQGQFSPERGLARAVLARAGLTIDATSELALEAAVRQNGRGSWLKGQYSRSVGSHWRATFEGNWIRGRSDDFFGQFARSSNVNLTLRFSF